MEAAKRKLEAEMDALKNQPYIGYVGTFLIGKLEENPEWAEKLNNPEKTIAKAMEEMKKQAQKNATNGMVVLSDADGFAIVLQYFGIDPEEKKKKGFNVSLEELLS